MCRWKRNTHRHIALLGLRANAPQGRLYVAPALPHWLPDLRLDGLRCGGARLGLRFWREGERSRWEVVDQAGQIEVLDEPAEEIGDRV